MHINSNYGEPTMADLKRSQDYWKAVRNVVPVADAVAYVTELEHAWNGYSRILSIGIENDDSGMVRTIRTVTYNWTIWFDDNGNVYGEC